MNVTAADRVYLLKIKPASEKNIVVGPKGISIFTCLIDAAMDVKFSLIYFFKVFC